MKKLASICLLFVCALAMCGQSSTPNIGLQIPATGSNNWYIPLNYNFTKLDLLLSGNSPLPNLTVTGNGTFNGVVTAAGFAGPGGSGSALTTGAAQYSPAYFSAPGTGFVINGVTPFNGAAYYSTGAVPRAWLSSDVGNLLKFNATNCNTTGYVYSPFSNACVPNSGGGFITSLTTTGSSGAASVTSGVLNIPIYSGGGNSNLETCTLNSTNFKCLGVSPYLAVAGDWTGALQQAITDLSSVGGGIIYAACGTYNFTGAFQDPSHANAQILLPSIAAYTTNPQQSIKILGCVTPPGATSNNGTIFTTSATGGNFIAGYNAGGPYPGFTSVWFEADNITFRSYANPNIVMLNAQNALAAHFKNIWCDTGAGSSTPTNAASGCIWMPTIANNVSLSVENATATGYYESFIFTEHTHVLSAYAANCVDAFKFDNGTRAGIPVTYDGNGASVDYLWEQQCDHTIVGPTSGNPITVNIQMAESELPNSADVYDPSNLMHGSLAINNPYQPHTIAQTGGTNLKVCNIFTQAGCNGNLNGGVQTVGLLNFWPSQQRSGAIIQNNGFDWPNYLTATNVTWNSVSGFPVLVATYNGINSWSIAHSNTSTVQFDGTLSMSGCTWFNMQNLTAGDNWLFTNIDAGGLNGFGMEVFGTPITGAVGSVNVYIANAIPGSMIEKHTAPGLITVGSRHFACFTYFGGGIATDLKIYVDGVEATTTTQTDNLVGSASSIQPLNIGGWSGASLSTPASIADVAIYAGALSAAEVANNYAAGP